MKSKKNTITDLIADLEQMKSLVVMEYNQEEVPQFYQGFDNHEVLSVVDADRCEAMISIIAKLIAENQALKADKDRMDYICSITRSDPKMDGNHVHILGGRPIKGPTLRDAITAEMIRLYGKPEMPKDETDN